MNGKLTHEESVELMLLFICSQVGAANVMHPEISSAHKDEITNQMECIAKVIKLDIPTEISVH